MISRFSRPVSSSWIAVDCPASPMHRRTAAASRTTSYPSMITRPEFGAEQRCQHADGGGLAGTVGAEHAEHAASRNVEVDPAQGVHLAKGLVEP